MKNALILVLLMAVAWLTFLLGKGQKSPPVEWRPYPEIVEEEPATSPLESLAFHLETNANGEPANSMAVGFCLLSEDGLPVFEKNADTAYIPASALKTLTTSTALEQLGADHRFTSSIRANAPIQPDGSLDGDLVVLGGGDPTLSIQDLEKWVAKLQEIGLKTITGGIVADASYFADDLAGEFWNWGDVGNGYGSPVAGINLEHNRYWALVRGGEKDGDPAEFLRSEPTIPQVAWDAQLRTDTRIENEAVSIFGGPRATTLRLRGAVPAGRDVAVNGAVPDPALFAASILHDLATSAGILIEKPPRGSYANVPAGHELFSHASAPLIDIVCSIHRVSDNHETECVFQLLGKLTGKPPANVIREHWKKRGLDLGGSCRIVDGSGLGRANYITPRALATLQSLALSGPCGDLYKGSLNSHFDGAVQWKAGAMSGVRAYTGYVTAKSGRKFSFALLFNHFSTEKSVVTSDCRDSVLSAIIEEL